MNAGSAMGQLQKNSDLILVLAVILVVGMMIVPLPWYVVDVLLALNLTLSVVILLVTMYTAEALEFSIFPAMLLIATLFRLALNISATRLILLRGFAGNMIAAFGHFVVGGNPVVGFILFLILVVIQFIVITKGAERVAEVAARFTLDAMPGKQMAIDADLNAGIIDDVEARKRRRDVEREADFYGAMDGASKFTKGDAIAALIITAINLLGGFAVGMLQQGLSLGEALERYALMTVGNGILSQIPALMISVAAGIIVTRAASDESLGSDVARQLVAQPRALKAAALFMLVFMAVPALPKVPFLLLGIALLAISRLLENAEKARIETETQEQSERMAAESKRPEAIAQLSLVDPIEIELGYSVVGLADASAGGDLLDRVYMIRRQIAADLGLVIPPVRIRDNLTELLPRQYAIKLRGVTVAGGELYPDHLLVMGPTVEQPPEDSIAVTEPVFGLSAWWIRLEQKEQCELMGLTVVDPSSVLATHLSEVVRNQGYEILSRQDVQQILELVRADNPAVVDELLPSLLSLGEIQKVFQNLLREGVPIKDSVTILESLADHARQTRDTDVLTEMVRRKFARLLSALFDVASPNVAVLTLDPNIESHIAEASENGFGDPALAPDLAHKILLSLSTEIQIVQQKGLTPVLICSTGIRPQTKRLTERIMPRLTVLSYAELDRSVTIKPSGMVMLE